MIEELKELLTMVQEVPEMVLHVLAGFAVYKIVIFLGTSVGIYSTIRLGINKLHDYKIQNMNKPRIIEHKIGEYFITHDGTFDLFMSLVMSTKKNSSYIHKSDVQFIIDAVNEKKSRENIK